MSDDIATAVVVELKYKFKIITYFHIYSYLSPNVLSLCFFSIVQIV